MKQSTNQQPQAKSGKSIFGGNSKLDALVNIRKKLVDDLVLNNQNSSQPTKSADKRDKGER